jgi:hypothetical protein
MTETPQTDAPVADPGVPTPSEIPNPDEVVEPGEKYDGGDIPQTEPDTESDENQNTE